MGEVYRAKDTRLDRTVAVKVLASHLSSSPELKQRMEREARAISSMNHSNICHLYDIGSQDGVDYLVMEFLEGETLADRLRAEALPLPEVYKIGIACCRGSVLCPSPRHCTVAAQVRGRRNKPLPAEACAGGSSSAAFSVVGFAANSHWSCSLMSCAL